MTRTSRRTAEKDARFWYVRESSLRTRGAACADGNYARPCRNRTVRTPSLSANSGRGCHAKEVHSVIRRIPRADAQQMQGAGVPRVWTAGVRAVQTPFPDSSQKTGGLDLQTVVVNRHVHEAAANRAILMAKGIHESVARRERRVQRLVDRPASNLPAIGSAQEALRLPKKREDVVVERRSSNARNGRLRGRTGIAASDTCV